MRRTLLAAFAAAMVVAVPITNAAGASKAPDEVLLASRGVVAPGETVQLTSEDLRFERRSSIIKCPVSVLRGQVLSNTASDVTVSLTEARFGGGLNGACDFLLPPGEIGFPISAAGLPWTMKVVAKQLAVSIESPSGAFIERPGPTCIYSARKLFLASPGSIQGASVFEMSSHAARLKITNGCAARPRAATMSADWTLSSEGEPTRLQAVEP